LPSGYLVAELVAVSRTPDQSSRIVWPTAADKIPQAGFSTEDFIDAVITDVTRAKNVDRRFIFALGWSSGGPPLYAISLRKNTPVTGSFVAMSVFHPGGLPPLSNAKGRAYYIYHSKEDRTCPYRMADTAAAELLENGAKAKLITYPGGHGWRGPVYDDIRAGIEWLEKSQSPVQASGG
jgi:predicted esterase